MTALIASALLGFTFLHPTHFRVDVLLTDFNFPPKEQRSVEIDALSKDHILCRGSVVDHFLGSCGELSGLLLGRPERFRYERLEHDRKTGKSLHMEEADGAGTFISPVTILRP